MTGELFPSLDIKADPKNPHAFYMGLDLSVQGAGIVVIDAFGIVQDHGEWGESLTRDATDRQKVERMLYITTKIIDMARMVPVWPQHLHIGLESMVYSPVRSRTGRPVQSSSQTVLAELHGVVKSQLWMALKKIPKIIVASSARKKVLGKGRFSKGKTGKSEIISAVSDRLGHDWKGQHDLADAHVIAEHLRKMREEE